MGLSIDYILIQSKQRNIESVINIKAGMARVARVFRVAKVVTLAGHRVASDTVVP